MFLTLDDTDSLYAAYLSFVKEGGLFIPIPEVGHYAMGQFVSVTLTLMSEITPFSLRGRVIWITPKQSGYRTAGIGIQFDAQERVLKAKIEAYLAEKRDSEHLTHTL